MKFLKVLLLTLLSTGSLAAQPISSGMSYDDAFAAGKWEVTAGGAAFFSPFSATRNRAVYNYALAVVDAGYMLTDIKEWGPARGNVELVGELFGGPLFQGRGNYVMGMTLWGRYNFIQPDWRVVPYAQIGAGLGATDIDQSIIGQVFQFNLNVAFGARYFFRPDLALNAEYRYQHLSNANSGNRNVGVNAQGIFLGVSWFY